MRLLHRGPPPPGRAARRGRHGARRGGRRVGRPAPGAGRRRPAAPPQPGLQLRGDRPPRPGPRCRAEVVPAQLPRVLRASADRRRRRRARRVDPGRRCERAVRRGSALRGRRRPRARAARGDLRGHVGAGAAQRGGRSHRRDRPGQPLRQPDHGRPGRGPQAVVPLGVLALPRRVRLRGGRTRRVDHRPVLGRPGHGLRERRAAGRDRAVPAGRRVRGGRRGPGPAAAGADADGHVRREPADPSHAHR